MPISVKEILEIHELLEDYFAESEDPISPPGVKDQKLVESAAARPFQSVGQKDAYPTLYEKAAALFHSLVNNHAFHNGNKRVALVAAQVVLAQEGFWLEHPSDDEMYEFARATAAHEVTDNREAEVSHIAAWLENNSRKAMKGEHPLKYGELRHILRQFGFDLDAPDGDILTIYKNGEPVEKIIKQGIKGFRPYHTDYIRELRKRLKLTPEYGIDSNKFYGNKGSANTASQFIELRLEVMKRLAKT
jgi:death-on-curing protein